MPRKKATAEVVEPVDPKADHAVAVATFDQADADFHQLEEFVASGQFLNDIIASCGNDVVKAQREWATVWDRLRTLLEDRNAKRKSAADAMRQVVQLTHTQWRGPEGAPTTAVCGPFSVTSVTGRGFDAETLLTLARNHGVLERMMELKTVNKDGKEVPLVRQSWSVDYDGISAWLRANQLTNILDGAYDEKEKTPQVKGPKELAFLGDKKGD